MQMSQFIEGLQEDLQELAAIGGEDLQRAAQQLSGAIKQSARLRLIDALTQAALELSEQLPNGHVDVRVAGQDPEFVFVQEQEAEPPAPPVAEGDHARITLRLPESLKASIEAAAANEGVSVNTWLVRALTRAIHGGGGGPGGFTRTGKRITGYSQA
jgi:predicted DNA binding CopG/RHH family protein